MAGEFRYRGVKVVADLTEIAQFDAAGYQISEARLDEAAKRLKAVPFSPEDRVVGTVRIRELGGYDYLFFVGREADEIVITLAGIVLPKDEQTEDRIRRLADIVATARGAIGI